MKYKRFPLFIKTSVGRLVISPANYQFRNKLPKGVLGYSFCIIKYN